jgi:N utilization substance protein A
MNESSAATELREILNQAVPEVASGAVEVVRIARKPGRLALIAVRARDPTVHPVSVFVDVTRNRGSLSQLGPEKVSAVLWSDSPEALIRATISARSAGRYKTPKVTLDLARQSATVEVESAIIEYMHEEEGLRLTLASELVGFRLSLLSFESGAQ